MTNPIAKKKYKVRQFEINLNNSTGSFTDIYIIFNATNEAEAYEAVKNASEEFIEIENIKLSRIKISVSEQGTNLWQADVNYQTNSIKSVAGLSSSYSWNISYETEHITHGLEHVGDYSPDGNHQAFFNALNVVDNYGKLEVQGTDINRAIFNFSKRIEFSPGSITNAKVREWALIANHVNSRTFMGYEPGEVRFNGAQGDETIGKPVNISFSFSVKRNERNRKFGDEIKVPLIRGWDDYWVFYKYVNVESKSQAFQNILEVTKQPASVHVSNNYHYDTFNSLSFLNSSQGGSRFIPGAIY